MQYSYFPIHSYDTLFYTIMQNILILITFPYLYPITLLHRYSFHIITLHRFILHTSFPCILMPISHINSITTHTHTNYFFTSTITYIAYPFHLYHTHYAIVLNALSFNCLSHLIIFFPLVPLSPLISFITHWVAATMVPLPLYILLSFSQSTHSLAL